MAAPRYYLDTSAYLAVILGEKGADQLSRTLEHGNVVSSVLLPLEAGRNLVRLSRERRISEETFSDALVRLREDIEGLALRDLTLDLCAEMVMPAVQIPRALDLGHLRTALWFHRQKPLTRFISLDERQLRSARELDLPI